MSPWVARLMMTLSSAGTVIAGDSIAARRDRMVRDQIEKRGVRDAEVLRVMRATPRHLFVPPAAQAMAYEDRPLSIGYGATIFIKNALG